MMREPMRELLHELLYEPHSEPLRPPLRGTMRWIGMPVRFVVFIAFAPFVFLFDCIEPGLPGNGMLAAWWKYFWEFEV